MVNLGAKARQWIKHMKCLNVWDYLDVLLPKIKSDLKLQAISSNYSQLQQPLNWSWLSKSMILSRLWLKRGREKDKERDRKVAHSRICSCMRYYVIVHIEDNGGITKCSNDMIYEILSRKVISSCYRRPSCRGEMKEKLYIKRARGALWLSHFIFRLKSAQ